MGRMDGVDGVDGVDLMVNGEWTTGMGFNRGPTGQHTQKNKTVLAFGCVIPHNKPKR